MGMNGLIMIVDPSSWYSFVPGVPATGPFNPHFVRDIGIAFATAAVALAWSTGEAGWRASALAALFLVGHSILHLVETAGGHHHDVLANEALAVHLPAWLAAALSLLQRQASATKGSTPS
jgi:hypothetical protein